MSYYIKPTDDTLASAKRFCLKRNKLGASEEVRYELRIQETWLSEFGL